MNKQDYSNALHNGICTVVFRKKNGELRTMRCTLESAYIDTNGLTPVGGGASGPDTQVRCVDVDKNEWRSFNIDSVISFN